MIPKKIHYCWFGRGKKNKLVQKCIKSWKKYCSDYEIIEWNEDNFDINLIEYTRFTYDKKLYAYLSDYVRLWVVEQFGGLYFDTDVELINQPELAQKYDAYFGFENNEFINTGIGFGASAHHPILGVMMGMYEQRSLDELETEYTQYHALTGSPKMNTYALLPFGLQQNGMRQKIYGAEILPIEYLCPYDDLTGTLNTTPNSFSIHWYSKSANGTIAVLRSKFSRPLHRAIKLFGIDKKG